MTLDITINKFFKLKQIILNFVLNIDFKNVVNLFLICSVIIYSLYEIFLEFKYSLQSYHL